MHQLDRAPKGTHVDKQLPILYVRRDDFLGRAAALRLFLRPQVSIVRAPGDGPHPRRPGALPGKSEWGGGHN